MRPTTRGSSPARPSRNGLTAALSYYADWYYDYYEQWIEPIPAATTEKFVYARMPTQSFDSQTPNEDYRIHDGEGAYHGEEFTYE
jgi:hypothetical protein